jgi:hypothetical protein
MLVEGLQAQPESRPPTAKLELVEGELMLLRTCPETILLRTLLKGHGFSRAVKS